MGRKSQSKAGAGPRVTFIRLQNWRGLGFAWLESQMPRSRHGHIVLGFAGKLKATWKKFSRLSANAGPCGDKGGSVYRHGEKVAFPTGCFLQARPRRSPAPPCPKGVVAERPRRRPAAARCKTGRPSQEIAACAGENHGASGRGWTASTWASPPPPPAEGPARKNAAQEAPKGHGGVAQGSAGAGRSADYRT